MTRFFLLLWCAIFTDAVSAQVIRANPFYTFPEDITIAPAVDCLLDTYTGAAVAYSLRKLDKDYTGNAVRVRRSSDNAEQDIGFLTSGHLDTVSLKSFVGSGNDGFVVRWYNQADSSGIFGVRNLSQTTATLQPRIISNNVIERVDDMPSVKFDAVNDYLWDDSVYVFTSLRYAFAFLVSKTNNAGGSQVAISVGNSLEGMRFQQCSTCGFTGNLTFVGVSGGAYGRYVSPVATNLRLNTQQYNGFLTGNNSRYIMRENATQRTLSFSSTIPASVTGRSIIMSTFQKTSYFWDGYILEFIYYPINRTTEVPAIESNINAYHTIY